QVQPPSILVGIYDLAADVVHLAEKDLFHLLNCWRPSIAHEVSSFGNRRKMNPFIILWAGGNMITVPNADTHSPGSRYAYRHFPSSLLGQRPTFDNGQYRAQMHTDT